MILEILFIIVGFVFLIKGADFLVDGSSNIAKKFKIPEIIIGLTIVSIGTSMPELFVSITSSIDSLSDVAIGNVIGSNLCNLLLILGLSSLIMPIKVQKGTKYIDIPLCLIFSFFFMLFCNTNEIITKNEAFLLIVLFVIFIFYTIFVAITEMRKMTIKSKGKIKISEKIPLLKNIFFVVIGIVFLKVGGDLSVDNAVLVARRLNISEKVIGLTILAVGTSLPELITSITASLKGNCDIAIGNIIGSNIFNMLFIIGVSAIISPINYNLSYNFEMVLFIVSVLLLWLFLLLSRKNEMNKCHGIVYLSIYLVYLLVLLVF